jgi:hypothetical protein
MATRTDATRPRSLTSDVEHHVGTSPTNASWDLAPERMIDDGEALARGLAWFSIGLGIAEVAAARRLARGLGMPERAELIRVFGLREIAQGLGILQGREPEPWVLIRIAGDLLDLGALATGLTPKNRRRQRVVGAMAAVAGVTAADVLCAMQLREQRRRSAA